MEKNSGVKFSEAQVALAREWIGVQSTMGDIKEITVQAPVATKEGINISDKTEIKNEVTPIPPSFEAAKAIVEKFEHGSDDIRGDEDVSDTVVQHVLLDKTTLLDEKWEGTAEEELDACVSRLAGFSTVDGSDIVCAAMSLSFCTFTPS
jgi:phospholipase D1/2